MRKSPIIITSVFVVVLGSLASWRAHVHREEVHSQEVAEAKAFCESLLPAIQRAQAVSGSYPKQVDPQWWAGRSVPRLIHTQKFYHSKGTNFLLGFNVGQGYIYPVWGWDSSWMSWQPCEPSVLDGN
ncbi:MAG TPA: hypothetical protein VNZ64_16240 [Candidatus Acidoferrum sp.]|jgi:hypothetical protein|nr:hypothetical protein [Candidatus Acidoferrum sp.]